MTVDDQAYLRFLARNVESAAQFEALMETVQGGEVMRDAVRRLLLPMLRSDIRKALGDDEPPVEASVVVSDDVDPAGDEDTIL